MSVTCGRVLRGRAATKKVYKFTLPMPGVAGSNKTYFVSYRVRANYSTLLHGRYTGVAVHYRRSGPCERVRTYAFVWSASVCVCTWCAHAQVRACAS